ncbi:MAG: F0F1 ATP synthase subunit B [Acidimicrobiales bacterium]
MGSSSLRRLGAGAALAVVLQLGGMVAASATESPGAGETELAPGAEECVEILEGGGAIDECQEAPNPIVPEANELIWGTISFVVLLVLLYRYAWPGLSQALNRRSERIRASLEEAERDRAKAHSVLEEYRRQLAEAKGEGARIIDEARQTADRVKRDLLARADAEADEARQRNASQIAAERDRVITELQSQVAGLAVELAEKVVEANLDREANVRLIERYIDRVDAAAGSGDGRERRGP